MKNRSQIFALIVALIIGGCVVGAFALQLPMVLAKTKIAPTKGEPGHPFTIIDTPERRLIDDSKAVFKLDGSETVVDLRTHKPHATAQGELPQGMPGGEYYVFIKQPDGTEIEIGLFTVLAPVAEPTTPSITPTWGDPGSTFTITDPKGRMSGADRIIFAVAGAAPEAGMEAINVWFSSDGETATGEVPYAIAPFLPHDVTVHAGDPTINPPIFNALEFFTGTPLPSITPTWGNVNSIFTITDPKGRMTQSDRIIFSVQGTGPEAGTPATDVVFSPDGTTATGRVPSTLDIDTAYDVTVHIGDPELNPPLFNALEFSTGIPPPSMTPTSGSVGTPFTITDPKGRMTHTDRIIFAVAGTGPEAGTWAENVWFSPDGTTATGTVPGTLAPGLSYDVTVHEGDPTVNPAPFNAFSFAVT